MEWFDSTAPRPAPHIPVWVLDDYYHEYVTIGYWDGFTWRLWYGTDDCNVSHWAKIEIPDVPR